MIFMMVEKQTKSQLHQMRSPLLHQLRSPLLHQLKSQHLQLHQLTHPRSTLIWIKPSKKKEVCKRLPKTDFKELLTGE